MGNPFIYIYWINKVSEKKTFDILIFQILTWSAPFLKCHQLKGYYINGNQCLQRKAESNCRAGPHDFTPTLWGSQRASQQALDHAIALPLPMPYILRVAFDAAWTMAIHWKSASHQTSEVEKCSYHILQD